MGAHPVRASWLLAVSSLEAGMLHNANMLTHLQLDLFEQQKATTNQRHDVCTDFPLPTHSPLLLD